MFVKLLARQASQGLLAQRVGIRKLKCASRSLSTTIKYNDTSKNATTLTAPSSSAIAAKTKNSLPAKDDKEILPRLSVDRPLFYPDQMEWLDERMVRISRPTKNVMQSGTAYTNCWKIEFNSQARYENWLMGWTSSDDPVSNLILTFPTKEAAIAFCDRNILQWFVEEQPERKIRRKSYADNFSWNKRTRLGSK